MQDFGLYRVHCNKTLLRASIDTNIDDQLNIHSKLFMIIEQSL